MSVSVNRRRVILGAGLLGASALLPATVQARDLVISYAEAVEAALVFPRSLARRLTMPSISLRYRVHFMAMKMCALACRSSEILAAEVVGFLALF